MRFSLLIPIVAATALISQPRRHRRRHRVRAVARGDACTRAGAVVLDNGTDVGNVNPGATTRAVAVTSSAPMGFHCTLHPTMVGTINGTAPAPAPDPGTNY